MKIKVKVSYPWLGAEDDWMIIDVDDDCDQATLDSMIYATAEDLVWDTASYSWEKVEENLVKNK